MKKAPDFSLPDQEGKIHSLADYMGRWLVLYFYPKDDTPGCTTEACSFRDSIEDYKVAGVVVLGVSKDTVRSHAKFAEKFALNFPILSDKETTTIQAYGAWGQKKFMGREFMGILRRTVVINPQGEIVKEYSDVDVKIHAAQILDDLKTLQ